MTSDTTVSLVAIMTPHPGRMDRVRALHISPSPHTELKLSHPQALDLLTQATHMVRENEPGNIRYQLHVEMNGDERGESIVFLETYDPYPTIPAQSI